MVERRFRLFEVRVLAWGLDIKAEPVNGGQFDTLSQAMSAINIIPNGAQLMIIDFDPQETERPTHRGKIVHIDLG